MKRNCVLKTRTPLRAKKPWNPVRKPLASRTKLKTYSTLKSHSTLKAKKPMRKVGKVGRANLAANKKIKLHINESLLQNCEIDFEGCLKNFALTIAHRHKRAWYKGDAELLSNPKQWVIGCVCCHDAIEHNKDLTEETFNKLRGPEELQTNL